MTCITYRLCSTFLGVSEVYLDVDARKSRGDLCSRLSLLRWRCVLTTVYNSLTTGDLVRV